VALTDVEDRMIRGSIANTQKAIGVVKTIIYYLERREDRRLREKVYNLMGKHKNDKPTLIKELEKEKDKIFKKAGDMFSEEEKNVIKSTKETVDNILCKKEKEREKEPQDIKKDTERTVEQFQNRRSVDDVIKNVKNKMRERRAKEAGKVISKVKNPIRFTKP
jgi:vacuolar-type H+-ATPase subunit H